MEPVWHRSPQRLHSAVGLTDGLIKLGNLDGVLKSDELDDREVESLVFSLLNVVVASANESESTIMTCQS